MSIFNSIIDGLYGYEKPMLIGGSILFVFALAAIVVMIVQRRDVKMAMGLINPDIKIDPAVLHAARARSHP